MSESSLSLAGQVEVEVEIKAPAEKFYEMYTGKAQHCVEATPSNVQACDLHEGEWGTVGSVIVWNYFHDGKAKVAKEIVEVVESEKRLVRFRVVEGDLMEDYKSFLITVQVTPEQEGLGSVVKLQFDYEKIDEDVVHPETLFPFFVEMIKEVDEHLMSQE
ncbi:MLP-like protein 28 [Cardamine amara subsp. amara]|uniref:MLP-like protein 28 n=1 Tax=Cardamine amara subsp. amara TaxID=228776 RepID=A0ABD1BM55_CARAN